MKAMNFSFICSLIFMIGFLELIRTEPYPKLNFWNPFHDKLRRLGNANYIVLKYKNDVNLSWNSNVRRFVMNGNQISLGTLIPAGTKVEIYFDYQMSSLSVFLTSTDQNYQKIISVDFSNIDSSKMFTMGGVIMGCNSIKIANFSNLKILKPNPSPYENTYPGISTLEIIDFSNANIPKTNEISSLFTSDTKLRYLNIKGTTFSTDILGILSGKLYNNLNIICQDEGNKISKGNSIYTCCHFDAKMDKCESSNYIKIYYENSKTFSNGFYDKRSERREQEISFVIHGDSILLHNESFTVNNGSIVEIYFKKSLSSLSNYFSGDTMTSVDFSHFVTSKLTNFNGVFKNCESLKIIDLSKLSLANNFESFCLNCINLESANLSHITNKSIENIKSMFSQCSKLKTIDISGLNMEAAESDSAFNGLNSLEYINIKDSKLSEDIINDIKKLENNLTICQNSAILAKKGYKYACCSYEGGKEICKTPNFITVYFAKEENNEFQCNKNYIEAIYVISGDSAFTKEEMASKIKVDSKMDIFFKTSSLTSLEGFFEGASNIVSVDFSNFDSSSVNSFKSLFKGCSALQSVNLQKSDTSSITTMENMFQNCESLVSIDLSIINTKSLTNIGNLFNGCKSLLLIEFPNFQKKIANMKSLFNGCEKIISIDLTNFKIESNVVITSLFYGCTSLKKIDISGLDLSSVKETNDAFSNLESLKYINITNIQASDDIKRELNNNLNGKNDLIVCQNQNILEGDNFINICCNFLLEKEICEAINYITVYYGHNVAYEPKFGNEYRNQIKFIISGDSQYKNDESFEISKGSKIEISLSSSIISLEKFFDKNYDNNAQYIESIDLSNFDWSNVTSYESFFNGCSSLKKVIFPNSKTPSLTKIDSMFNGCSSLLEVDLTKFNMGEITNLNNLLNGCKSLKAINIQGINLMSVTSTENIFEGINPLKYINIKDINIPENIQNLLVAKFNNQENLIVCQNPEEILNKENYKEICCDYDVKDDICRSSNYIVISMNQGYQVTYDLFENNDINFFIYNGATKSKNEEFKISGNSKLEMHLSSPPESLVNFFQQIQNLPNVLTSVDLSNLDTSKLNNIKGMFKNFKSLKIANFSGLNMQFITSMEEVFYNCEILEFLDLSGTNLNKVTSATNILGSKSVKYLNIKKANISGIAKNYILYDLNNDINIICKDKKDSISTFGKSYYSCCNFEALNHICDLPNYIKVYFERTTNLALDKEYYKFIIYGYKIFGKSPRSEVSNSIEIYMKDPLTTLEGFFSGQSTIRSVDLSNVDASQLTSLESAFSWCTSLSSFDFSNFKAPKLTKIDKLFEYCNYLQKVNLSYVTTGIITGGDNIFSGCWNLQILDMSGLSFSDRSYSYFLTDSNYLGYLDIKGATLANDIKNSIKNNFKDLKICQDKSFIIKDDFKYVCCDYSKGYQVCENINYMIIYLKEENNIFNFEKYYKDNIRFIISGETGMSKDDLSSETTVSSKLKIYFSSPLTTLENFFEGVLNIVSVDLSHLDLSLIHSFQSMFKDSSLSSIDLSNLNARSLTNMSSMFEGCSGLLYVNLSNLKTSKEIDMGNLLKGCTNLKGLDIHGFNFINEVSNTNLFESFPNLNYLNIKDVVFKDTIKQEIKNIIFAKNKTIICQNDDSDIEKNIFNKYSCCNYFFRVDKCQSFNFIKAQYNTKSNIEINYNKGFGDKREGIEYIKLGDKMFKTNEEFIINANTNNGKLEIYFTEEVTSLKDTFNANIDSNVENIISIDFSNFNTSFLTDISSLFKGCTGLQTIDFSNFDTS